MHSSLRKLFSPFLALALPIAAFGQTNLTVNVNQTVRSVDERVFGVNSVIWDGKAGSDQTIAMVQNAGIRAIRVPGGSLSDEYHWRINKSLSNTWRWSASYGDYPASDSTGGPTGKGFINLITSANTQAVVTVNYGSGTPEEAAALVAYLNSSTGSNVSIGIDSGPDTLSPNYQYNWQNSGYWASLRAATSLGTDDGMNFLRIGRTTPVGAKYFEIGNECYGTWEKDNVANAQGTDDHNYNHDPTTYANRAAQYITKMKAVDPTIKIGVVVVTSSENGNYKNWTPVMLARLKVLNAIPDFIIYHLYPQAPFAESDAGLLQVPDSGSKSWTSIATDLRGQLNTYLSNQASGVEIVVTENNDVYERPGKQSTSLVNGLYLADSTGNLMQTEINGYMWWALRNGSPTVNNAGTALDGSMSSSLYGWRQFGDYGMLSSPSTLTGETTYYNAYPTYYAMKLLSHFARNGDTVVQATSPNTLLSIFATKHTDGSLALLVINKDPANTLNANIALTGFTPGATATTYTYGKPQDTAAQTGSGSTDIATGTMTIGGTIFPASFAPYSVTVISLPSPNVAPVFSYQPAGTTVSPGASVTFAVAASGTPTFQWQKNGVTISGATSNTYSILSVSASDAGNYTAIATNSAGSTTSDTAILTVNVAPTITTQPLSQTITTGGAVTFTVASSGAPTPTYQWKKEGVAIGGATGSSYTIASTALGDVGSYTVVVTNSLGSATSNAATLAVGTPPAGFDTAGYLARYPVVAALYGTNPYGAWIYYHDHGIYDGEVYDDLFRVEEYLTLYPELFTLFGDDLGGALVHWLTIGRLEGKLGRIPLEFSATGYFTRNPDVATAVNNDPLLAWGHYWLYGIYEGRAYDDELRVFEYLAINADLTAAFVNDWRQAALHWMRYGRTEGRLGRLALTFNVTVYLNRNPDVLAVYGTNPTTVFLHYWAYGIDEGRTYDDLFRPDEYLALNPDLAAALGTDRRLAFKHWVRYGMAEGRPGRNP